MRYEWLAVAALLFSTQSYADVKQELQQCAVIQDKLERLICYDKLAKRATSLKATTNPKTEIAIATKSATRVESATDQVEEFGITKPKEDAIERIELVVTKVKKSPYGHLIMTFENGQKWRQTDSTRFRLKAGATVFIKKAALGSFMLGTPDRNSTIRVKRIN